MVTVLSRKGGALICTTVTRTILRVACMRGGGIGKEPQWWPRTVGRKNKIKSTYRQRGNMIRSAGLVEDPIFWLSPRERTSKILSEIIADIRRRNAVAMHAIPVWPDSPCTPCATVHPQRNPPCSPYQKQIQSGPQHVYTVPNPTSLLGCNWTSSGREGAWAIVMTRFMTKKLKLRTMLIQRQTNAHGPPSNRMLVHFCKQMISYSWQTYKKHGPTHACTIILLFANSQVTTKGRFYQMIYARTVKFSHFF
jgi:hypothetical protein